MGHISLSHLLVVPLLIAVMPSSSNYQLNNFNYGSGGTSNSSSSSYNLNATTGQTGSQSGSSANYTLNPGNNNAQQSDVPPIPTFTNTASYYNKLRFIIDPGPNPTDTKFVIAISSDNFVTTLYIQSDNTVSPTKGIEDYQTYTAWGGAGGQLVTGLAHSTTYQIKVAAMQGSFTETGFGPAASAATVAPVVTFDIDVAATDTETAPPFTAALGDLLPATVVTAANRLWLDIETNGESGVVIYTRSQSAGLQSIAAAHTIASSSTDLTPAATGYGLQSASATQASGGPLAAQSPYNGSTQNVGAVTTSYTRLYASLAPVFSGRTSAFVKAKAAATTPASNDYQDILTVVLSASF